MKRSVTFLLALVLFAALFAGCGNSGGQQQNPATTAPATGSPTTTPTAAATDSTSNTPEAESPYKFAAGKFEVDEKGLPTSKYDYELPITTTEEVITLWTSCYTPEWLPVGQEYPDSPYPVELKQRTGVNIEYVLAPSTSLRENFSVLIASDDLCDIMAGAGSYYSGVFKNAVVEDEFFINVYDYKDYCPNYIYEIIKDPNDYNLIERVFVEDDLILQFLQLKDMKYIRNGYFVRGDWLSRFGKTNTDLVTFEDIHEMLTLFKTQVEGVTYPMFLYATIEIGGFNEYTAYDTLASTSATAFQRYVVDGNVQLANTGDRDLALMTMINQWYSDGLIDPDWSGINNTLDADTKIHRGEYGYLQSSPNGILDLEHLIPEGETSWLPVTKPLLYEGQTLHVGGALSRIWYGSAAVSTKCENIPLAVSWIDYRYSDEGVFLNSYGVEGVTLEYVDGVPMNMEWFYNNEHPRSMLGCIYMLNTMLDPGMSTVESLFAFPGSETCMYAIEYWGSYPYDGLYEWPTSILLSDDDNDRVTQLSADILSYISENYLQFVDGSKPLSEWDSYVSMLESIGIDEVISIYQKAYNEYIATKH